MTNRLTVLNVSLEGKFKKKIDAVAWAFDVGIEINRYSRGFFKNDVYIRIDGNDKNVADASHELGNKTFPGQVIGRIQYHELTNDKH